MPSRAAADPRAYSRHEPEKGLWHKILRENLLSLLEEAKDPDDPESGIPTFVERELTDVLSCGVLTAGLLRLRCPDCKHERLVAFSCAARAACPSCGARRMAETAAHLVDRVLPDVALRRRGRDGPSPFGSGRPPHRTERAALPHSAPTSGSGVEAL